MPKMKNRTDKASARYGHVARIPREDVERAREWLARRAAKDQTITEADIQSISVAQLFRRLVNFAVAAGR